MYGQFHQAFGSWAAKVSVSRPTAHQSKQSLPVWQRVCRHRRLQAVRKVRKAPIRPEKRHSDILAIPGREIGMLSATMRV
jgi:hypothetical protein